MSVLDPMFGVSKIAMSLRGYAIRELADPHIACLPVMVPNTLEGLVLALDADTVNVGRTFDPYVVVFHAEHENSTLYVARSYLMSRLRWRHLPHKQVTRLRNMARIPYPDLDKPNRWPRPIRHGI